MDIIRKDLLTKSAEVKKILRLSYVGQSFEFADSKGIIGPSTKSNCCNDCVFSEEREHNAKCPHFECCSAHNRPDGHSVVFYDDYKTKCRNGYRY